MCKLPDGYEKPDWNRGLPLFRPDGSIWAYRWVDDPENYEPEQRDVGVWFVWKGGASVPLVRRLYRRALHKLHGFRVKIRKIFGG